MTRSPTMKGAAVLALGLLAVGPAAAQAPAPPDLFGTWKRVCADNGGVYTRTTAAPEVQGWTRFPLPIPLPSADAKLNRKTIRVSRAGESMRLFFAGEGDLKGARPAPFQMCAVAAEPAEFASVVRQVGALMNQPAVAGEKGMRSFRYHRAADGRRTPLEAGKLREIAPKLGPGAIISVDVAPQNKLTVVSYSIIKL